MNIDGLNKSLRCSRCGHTWLKRVSEPKECPRCCSYYWQVGPQSLKCLRCDHTWVTRRLRKPKICPKCHSRRWWIEPQYIRCRNCGHTWVTRNIKNPQKCPKCKCWIGPQSLKCLRCGHVWTTISRKKPLRCPNCKSLEWAKPHIQVRSTVYKNYCYLCGRELKGRGTKDKYTLDEIALVKLAPEIIREQNPYGLMVCRSIRKCRKPRLLKLLRDLTGRYDYSVHKKGSRGWLPPSN